MWLLINSEGTRTLLEPNKDLTIGRKKADIQLKDDTSVSKVHASITVIKDERDDVQTWGTCQLQDLFSKYGTYVSREGGEFLQKNHCTLEAGDKIRFGLQNHIFSILHVPLVTLTSTLSENDRKRLATLFDEMDCIISPQMNDSCTHLTVTCALLTEKVVWAMTSCAYIVTIDYWERMREALAMGTNIPDASDFVPTLQEGLISKDKVSLLPNEARKKLFNDLVFVFFSATQFKVYGKMVHMAGGKSVLFWKKRLTLKELCMPNVVGVQTPEDVASQACEELEPEYEEIYAQMRAKNLRIVPDREIPLAILHCSIKIYCNPRYKYRILCLEAQTPDLGEVQVPETQDIEQNVRTLPTIVSNIRIKPGCSRQLMNVIIPETCDILSDDEESPPTTQRHSGHNLQAEDEHSTSHAKKQSSKLKESAISPERSRKKENIQEKIVSPVVSPVDVYRPPKERGIIIPETIDLSDESATETSTSPIALSSEVYMSLIPKKKPVPEVVHVQTLAKSSKKSKTCDEPRSDELNITPVTSQKKPVPEVVHVQTLAKSSERSKTSDEPKSDELNITPVTSQVSSIVVNWLAVKGNNLPEDKSGDPTISRKKSQSRLSPAKISAANKRKRPPTDATEVEEDARPTKKILQLNESKEKRVALSQANTVRNILSNRPSCVPIHPVNKRFKKAKVLIPAQRISMMSMKPFIRT